MSNDTFSPQYDHALLNRRRYPSSMTGKTVDIASARLLSDQRVLADVPALRLLNLLDAPCLTRVEREAIEAHLRARREHSVFACELADPIFAAWLEAEHLPFCKRQKEVRCGK